MKLLVAFLIMFSVPVFAQVSGAAGSPTAVVAAPTATPIVVPVVSTLPAQPVVVDPDIVPPPWLQSALGTVKKVPVVGPYLMKALEWVGVLLTILTALCGFLMIAIKSLSGVLNLASLASAASLVSSFQSGKFMYYLKYISAFNAPKDPPPNA